jgi:hypothetical protein
MTSAGDDSVYELPVIDMVGGLDIRHEREEWVVTWRLVQCLGFPVLEGFFFQESVTAGVFYKNKHGIEFPSTVI